MSLKQINLTRKEIGIIGLAVFLMYGQCDDLDFDSIIGRTTVERNNAILSLKSEIAKGYSHTRDFVTCSLDKFDCEIIERILLQTNAGETLKHSGFEVTSEEVLHLTDLFS